MVGRPPALLGVALRVGLVPTEIGSHAVDLASVRRFEVIVAACGIATRRRHRSGAATLRGPRAVHAIVVDLPALAADCRSGYWFMIWKKPSEHVTGKIGVPSLVKF